MSTIFWPPQRVFSQKTPTKSSKYVESPTFFNSPNDTKVSYYPHILQKKCNECRRTWTFIYRIANDTNNFSHMEFMSCCNESP